MSMQQVNILTFSRMLVVKARGWDKLEVKDIRLLRKSMHECVDIGLDRSNPEIKR